MLGQLLLATSLPATYALHLWSATDGMVYLCPSSGVILHLILVQITMQSTVSNLRNNSIAQKAIPNRITQWLSLDSEEHSNTPDKRCGR